MPQFPRTKNDILVLAAKIALGIDNNPTEYPDPPFSSTALNLALGEMITLTADRVAKDAAAKAALDLENDKIEEVVDESKRLIRLAEATWNQDAGKLQLIGWDARAAAQSLPPGEVRNLEVVDQGAGTAFIDWKSPPGDRIPSLVSAAECVRILSGAGRAIAGRAFGLRREESPGTTGRDAS